LDKYTDVIQAGAGIYQATTALLHPADIAPAWAMVEFPVALVVKPLVRNVLHIYSSKE
jgi:hypothetical protein